MSSVLKINLDLFKTLKCLSPAITSRLIIQRNCSPTSSSKESSLDSENEYKSGFAKAFEKHESLKDVKPIDDEPKTFKSLLKSSKFIDVRIFILFNKFIILILFFYFLNKIIFFSRWEIQKIKWL